MRQTFAVARHDRAMHELGAEVQEEGLILSANLLEPAEGDIGQAVVRAFVFQQRQEEWIIKIVQAILRLSEDPLLVVDLLVIRIDDIRIIVFVIFAVGEVESELQRVRHHVLPTDMPLAHVRGGIACLLQDPGDDDLGRIEPRGVERIHLRACAPSARHAVALHMVNPVLDPVVA